MGFNSGFKGLRSNYSAHHPVLELLAAHCSPGKRGQVVRQIQNNVAYYELGIIYTNCGIVSYKEPKDNSLWQWNKKVVDFWSKSIEKHIDCEDHCVFTGARDKLIQSTPLQPIYVRSILLFFQQRLEPTSKSLSFRFSVQDPLRISLWWTLLLCKYRVAASNRRAQRLDSVRAR